MTDNKQQITDAVVQLQNGDGKAFEKLYNLTYKSAYFTALKITKNEQDAEDVLQNAYVKLLERVRSLDNPESFTSWFNMMVANESKNLMRKNKPELFADNVISGGKDDSDEEFSVFDTIEDEREEYTPGAGIEKDELQRDIMKLIDNLSDEKRTAVLLYYYNEMTTKQISESLGVSESTIKSRLIQAKKDLSKGVAELEKKNGKLLGVAPMPLVIWALRFASVSVGNSAAASSAAAATFTAVTAGAAATAGTGAAAAAGTGVAAKIVAGVVVAGIVAGGAVAGTRAARNRKNQTAAVSETTYTDTGYEGTGPEEIETEKETAPVTVPEYKNVETYIEKEDLKYGVSRTSENYAVRQDDGTGVVDGTSYLVRNGYSATYDDLLPAAQENSAAYSAQRSGVASAINDLRAASSLGALTVDDTLSEQANVRAEEIAWSGVNNSIRPDGSSYTTIFDHNGLSDGTRLEIRVIGCSDVSDAMKTISGRDELKNEDIEKIGVGVSEDPGSGRLVFVVHLYSADGSTSSEISFADRARFNNQSNLDDSIESIDDTLQQYEEFKSKVEAIPVIGDIYSFIVGDWSEGISMRLSKPFNSVMDRLEESAEESSNGRQ